MKKCQVPQGGFTPMVGTCTQLNQSDRDHDRHRTCKTVQLF